MRKSPEVNPRSGFTTASRQLLNPLREWYLSPFSAESGTFFVREAVSKLVRVLEQAQLSIWSIQRNREVCMRRYTTEKTGGQIRHWVGILFLVISAAVLASCDKTEYRDGTFSGRSGADDTGAWGEVTVTIQAGRITDCVFVTYEKDGTIKGPDYGKVNGEISNRAFYDKAQLAVRAMRTYAEELPLKQKPDAVDSITGATIAYNQFNEAVLIALEEAAKAR
jgi:major membrane immunogen (membrane-anchored lipoprotein)